MSKPVLSTRLIAFSNGQCVAEGKPEQVVTHLKSFVERHPESNLLVLNAVTSRNIELDFRASAETILSEQFDNQADSPDSIGSADSPGSASTANLEGSVSRESLRVSSKSPSSNLDSAETGKADGERKRGRGRPKLGVVSREVTLLPRHWEWLSNQRGGASVALRRLVDQARQSNGEQDKLRIAQDSAYRFMTVLAGDAPGYEEAIRRLYAKDLTGLLEITASWPADVARHTATLARAAIPA